MIKQFLSLEWKAFFRSASFKMNLFFKILLGFGALWIMISFLSSGLLVYFLIKEKLKLNHFKRNPLEILSFF